jgi:C-terminal processing protease CtpA/Prc
MPAKPVPPSRVCTQPAPGPRAGRTKHEPVTDGQADLRVPGRATVIGERTRGGAHAREGFTVHPHLEATVSVAEAVNPKTSGNWEGTGVTPDLQAPAAQARDTAYRRALQDVTAAGGSSAAEAQTALAAAQADVG